MNVKNKTLSVTLALVLLVITGLSVNLAAHPAAPKTPRNYMLVFEVTDYSSQLKEAVSHFFDNVFQPGDQLILVTPAKLVGFSRKKLAVPKKQLVANILAVLKTDIAAGSSGPRITLRNMESIVLELGRLEETDLQGQIRTMERYGQLRKNLAASRISYQAKLEKYSKIFLRVRGENHLIMFLQQEFRPTPAGDAMDMLRRNPRETGFKAGEVFQGENYKSGIDYKKLIATFKYAKLRFHFLYLKAKKIKNRRDIQYIDNMGDMYSDFSKLAKATDGVKLASAKPSFFVKQIRRVVLEGKVEVEVVEESMEK
jgi:hypothetical protein